MIMSDATSQINAVNNSIIATQQTWQMYKKSPDKGMITLYRD